MVIWEVHQGMYVSEESSDHHVHNSMLHMMLCTCCLLSISLILHEGLSVAQQCCAMVVTLVCIHGTMMIYLCCRHVHNHHMTQWLLHHMSYMLMDTLVDIHMAHSTSELSSYLRCTYSKPKDMYTLV